MSYLQGDVYVIVDFSICPLSCDLVKSKEKVHVWRLEECWKIKSVVCHASIASLSFAYHFEIGC